MAATASGRDWARPARSRRPVEFRRDVPAPPRGEPDRRFSAGGEGTPATTARDNPKGEPRRRWGEEMPGLLPDHPFGLPFRASFGITPKLENG